MKSGGASRDFIKMREAPPLSLISISRKYFARMPQKKRRTPMRLLIAPLYLASAANEKKSQSPALLSSFFLAILILFLLTEPSV